MRPRFSSIAFFLAICLFLTAGWACSGTQKAVQIAQSHPDSLAHAFVRICQRKAWDEIGSLTPTRKELKTIFRSLVSPEGEPRPQPTLAASQAAIMDTVAAQARRLLDGPSLDWPHVRLYDLQKTGRPQVLGQKVQIQKYILALQFPTTTLIEGITVWTWEGRHFLADFSPLGPIE